MSKPHLLQVGALPASDEALLQESFAVHRLWEAPDRAALLAEKGPRIRAIATRGDLGADTSLLSACPALEIVAVFGVGYDAVDIGTCRARGIRVTNTPDVLTDDCADLALGMFLALSRSIPAADAFVRAGSWARGGFPLQRSASRKRAGILGLGRIGRAVAHRCAGFGMPIAYSARSPKDVPADWRYIPDPVALAEESDVLFLTLAATADTRRIVDARVLAALGPDGMLVNISRAANLDETALMDALDTGSLGFAALDVFEGEPDLNPRFLTTPRILLQPHHASGTVETRRVMGQLLRDNLAAHFAGKPLPTQVV
jgi:lactate dehydrogenase-like 2-hydroxyacid dehydrogenase